TATNSGSSLGDAGIKVISRYNILTGNNASNNNKYGVYLQNSSDNRIQDNICKLNSNGINLEDSRNNTLSDNTANENGNYGIFLSSSSDNTLSGNTANEDFSGIGLYSSSDNNTLSKNTVNGNSDSGIDLSSSSNNNILSENTCNDNGYGIGLSSSSNNTLSGNTCSGCYSYGIGLYFSSANNTLSGNIVNSNNNYGIHLHSSIYNNLVFHNNLVNNSNNADDDNPADNDWHHPALLEGNYWSDYTGVDDGSGTEKHAIAGDGIGDTDIPHPAADYDFYPFMTESGWLAPVNELNITQAQTDKSTYALNENVTVSCIVQNETGYNITADGVNAEILKPDSSIELITMTEGLVGHYNGTFTNTSLYGTYNVTIYANKTGYVNDTAELWWNVTPVSPTPPDITSFAPPSHVSDNEGAARTFRITVNQIVNVSWYLNESFLFTNESVTEICCTLQADVIGEHNVSARASNANGSDMQTWTWTVTSPCFIATAAYGTPLHEDINVLRDFRDGYLMTNPAGRSFVNVYYTTSPPIAKVVSENEELRTIVREGMVKPLVYITKRFLR
ncbi:CASH domain-dontaining protein, partial [Candidatus Methanophagaceae archaeon]